MRSATRVDRTVGEWDSVAIDRYASDVMGFEGQIVAETGGNLDKHAMGTACDLGADAISGKEDDVGFQFKLPIETVFRNELEDDASEATRRFGRCWPRTVG